MKDGWANPGKRLLTATGEEWKVGYGRKMLSLVDVTMSLPFIEISLIIDLKYPLT